MNMKTNHNDITVPCIWVCMIGDEFLVVNGQTGCDTKEGIEELFKQSKYWVEIMKNYDDSTEEIIYRKFLAEKTVRFFEIKPTND